MNGEKCLTDRQERVPGQTDVSKGVVVVGRDEGGRAPDVRYLMRRPKEECTDSNRSIAKEEYGTM